MCLIRNGSGKQWNLIQSNECEYSATRIRPPMLLKRPTNWSDNCPAIFPKKNCIWLVRIAKQSALSAHAPYSATRTICAICAIHIQCYQQWFLAYQQLLQEYYWKRFKLQIHITWKNQAKTYFDGVIGRSSRTFEGTVWSARWFLYSKSLIIN